MVATNALWTLLVHITIPELGTSYWARLCCKIAVLVLCTCYVSSFFLMFHSVPHDCTEFTTCRKHQTIMIIRNHYRKPDMIISIDLPHTRPVFTI